MLRLPPFHYVAVRTLAEAVSRLAAGGAAAVPMAGGTDLLPHMKRQVRAPAMVVGLRHLRELQGVRVSGEGTAIGAACTLAEISRHPHIRRHYPFLSRAIDLVATATLREMGTIGGNLCVETRCAYFDLPPLSRAATGLCLKDGGGICLAAPRSARCWAVASSDCAPLLIALRARIRVHGPAGDRVMPLESLYEDDGLRPLRLAAGEIVGEILLPPPDGVRAAYHKLRRRGALEFPLAGAAVALRRDGHGRVAEARVVLSAVSSAPVVCAEAAEILQASVYKGGGLEPDIVEAAAAAAARAARPIDNTDPGAAWRKRVVQVAVRRAAADAAGSPGTVAGPGG